MYCSSCGAAVAKGLSYCNHCGTKMSGAKSDGGLIALTGMSLENLVWANAGIALGGLGTIIGLIAVMRFNNFSTEVTMVFAFLSFLVVMGAESVFIWLLWHSIKSAGEASGDAQLNKATTRELGAAQASVLSEPALSVTDHTTHTLNPLYIKRESE